MKHIRTPLAALISALLLTACLGGGSETPSNDNTAKLSGTVADGYLQGAKACLDKNSNGLCDNGELFAITDKDGKFSIDNVSAADKNAYAVVVEVPATAIDQDDGKPVGKPFVLTAPAGKPEFISPLTTLVSKQMDDSPGLSAVDAESAIKNKMGYANEADFSLFKDYVAEKNNVQLLPGKRKVYKTAHQVAQTVAHVMKENNDMIKGVATSAGLDADKVIKQLSSILLDQVMTKLEAIKDEAEKEGFVPANAADTVKLDTQTLANTLDKDTVKQQVEVKQQIADAKPSSAASILSSGIYWVDTNYMYHSDTVSLRDVEVGKFWLKSDNSLDEQEKKSTNGITNWLLAPIDDDLLLTNTGWELVSDGASSYVVSSTEGDTLVLKHKKTGDEFKIGMAAIDLSGQNIADTIARWAEGDYDDEFVKNLRSQSPRTSFGAGAVGYVGTFVNSRDVYELWVSTDWCDATQLAELNGNCNSVWMNSGGSGTYATKLEDALNEVGESSTTNVHWDSDLRFTLFKNNRVKMSQRDGSNWVDIVQQGVWERRTINGVEMLYIPVPAALRKYSDQHVAILAVHNGFVRTGHFSPKGAVETNLDFNLQALKEVMQAMAWTSPF